MELGRCPHCARPFASGEVTGLGILRTRPESEGGPIMEFTCPRCARQLRLIPYGEGRYALPGAPLPPPVPAEERRPPWVAEAPPEAPTPARAPAPPPPPADPPPVSAPPPAAATEDEPLSLFEALELLGVAPTADREEIEQAFRERSRTCHPDKVAHLDPEFQALAERKFRRLHEAYELLVS